MLASGFFAVWDAVEEKFENAINFEFIESRKGLYVCGMTDNYALMKAEQVRPGLSDGVFQGRI